ncbi:DoxX family membrane protein [Gordonia humi]|uniref:Putative oxidoreductase n=1 Tax=Gordonia humi TaxID=686429 RepID=A0A840F6H6_9ACTN|nr:putative oxidoreductase [Gordonia humi]
MSSSNDNDPERGPSRPRPRRPRPDRDDFIERHGRRPAPNPQPADVAADATDPIDAGEPTSIIEPVDSPADVNDTEVIERIGDGPADEEAAPGAVDQETGAPPRAYAAVDEPTSDSTAGSEETTRLPRSDVPVQSSDEPVTTEPFDDPDDERDRPRGERRTAEHLTQDPLPYIEPQPTRPIETEAPPQPFAPEPFDDESVAPPEQVAAQAPPARRGTVDLGLLVLRVALGVVFLLHGLQKSTGWLGGPGPQGFADFLANSSDPSLGFDENVTKILSLVAGVSETAGGVLLILGLFTPIAGAAVLSSILVAMTYKATLAGGVWFFAADGGGNGVEFEATLAAAAAAVILTGPGLYSVDRRWGWARRPAWGSAAWLVIGIGVAVAVWLVFNGANPLVNM